MWSVRILARILLTPKNTRHCSMYVCVCISFLDVISENDMFFSDSFQVDKRERHVVNAVMCAAIALLLS